MRHQRRTYPLILLLLSSLFLAACAGGEGDGDLAATESSPDLTAGPLDPRSTGPVIVYLADQDQDDVDELYLAAKRSSSVKLNPPFRKGQNVTQYAITPDRTGVVYLANQDTKGVYELYRVDFAAPGRSTKLNGRLVAGGDVIHFEITSDGTGVVYHADERTNDVNELFYVRFAAPRVSTRLNPGLASDRDVRNFSITPDGTAVVYTADQDTSNAHELYLVSLATPGVSTKLNSPLLVAGDGVQGFQITPDSQAAVYLAFQRSDLVAELYWVALRIPGITSRIGPPGPLDPSSALQVSWYRITPDSSAVVFTGERAPASPLPSLAARELFFARFLRAGSIITLNRDLEFGRRIEDFEILPDSRGVVYLADDRTLGKGLYRVSFLSPGDITRLNSDLHRPASFFQITPDGDEAMYLSYDTHDPLSALVALYRVRLETSGASLWVADLANDLVVHSFAITPDSSGAVYMEEQTGLPDEIPYSNELYRRQFVSPDIKTKLNGPLVRFGDVRSFQVK